MEETLDLPLIFLETREKTQEFLNDLLEISKKYGIEFHNGYIYPRKNFEFGQQYVWSEHGIEMEDLLG